MTLTMEGGTRPPHDFFAASRTRRDPTSSRVAEPDSTYLAPIPKPPAWSRSSRLLFTYLETPVGLRARVPYRREFVDEYIPNESSLLPRDLAKQLYRAAFWQETLPYGSQGVRMMDEFLLDLAWSSSRLEGNPYSREQTAALFSGDADDQPVIEAPDHHALMLLNHRNAIDLMVRRGGHRGLTRRLVQDLHAKLMEGLLGNPLDIGNVRNTPVGIRGSAYQPSALPGVLHDMLDRIVSKAAAIRNPVEAAFFLWVNIAYLQAFIDGNKRTSRLSANVPLMLRNCAPLSFMDVQRKDYGDAMLGVYERLDVSAAVDLFEWIYRRSMHRYLGMLEQLPMPDPRRVRYYHQIRAAMRAVVIERKCSAAAVAEQDLPPTEHTAFADLLREVIAGLHENNGAPHDIEHEQVVSWIASGRPH